MRLRLSVFVSMVFLTEIMFESFISIKKGPSNYISYGFQLNAAIGVGAVTDC
jgi:hypothetical protein